MVVDESINVYSAKKVVLYLCTMEYGAFYPPGSNVIISSGESPRLCIYSFICNLFKLSRRVHLSEVAVKAFHAYFCNCIPTNIKRWFRGFTDTKS